MKSAATSGTADRDRTPSIAVQSTADLEHHMVEKAYARWAPVYDAIIGPVFLAGRRAAAQAAGRVGGRILEIGVGTGLSFPDYDASTEITGIDLSAPMLEKARQKAGTGRFPQVKALAQMDAHDLAFPDSSFDCVVAQFVITLVQSPERVLDECARVVRPGGEVVLVNHLYSETGVAAAVERWFAKRTRHLGLRPEFPFARIAAWRETRPEMTLVERTALKPFGVYTLIRFRKEPVAAV